MVKLGKYKHFKGNLYNVLANATNAETGESEVVYQAMYGEQKIWIRPARMWNETIELDGERVKRFTFLEDENKEIVQTLLCNEKVRLEKIISNGVASPNEFWYCQDENEWVSLMSGEAEIEFEDKTVKLATNGQMYIPACLKHRVKSVSDDATWLCLFFC